MKFDRTQWDFYEKLHGDLYKQAKICKDRLGKVSDIMMKDPCCSKGKVHKLASKSLRLLTEQLSIIQEMNELCSILSAKYDTP